MKTGIYRHYKGGLYLVLGVGQHTETREIVVVYVALTGIHYPGPHIRVRPKAMFEETVNGIPRFAPLGDGVDEVHA